MKEPAWISDEIIYAIHAEQLAEHGGQAGIRNADLLHAVLDMPKNLFHNEQANLFKLAAVYGYKISNHQPFVDGNNRTGYIAARLFFLLNGYDISVSEVDRVQMFLDISRNERTENDLANWFKQWIINISD